MRSRQTHFTFFSPFFFSAATKKKLFNQELISMDGNKKWMKQNKSEAASGSGIANLGGKEKRLTFILMQELNLLLGFRYVQEVPLTQVDGKTLAKIVTYLKRHAANSNATDEKKKKFDEEFVSDKEVKDLLEIVMAANFLDIKALMDIICQRISVIMKNKSVEWVRKTFNIENDLTPEEEQEIRNEHRWAWEDVESDSDDDEQVKPSGV